MITLISIFCTIFFILSIILGYKLYTFSIIILNTETAIEDSITVLNERYESMTKILDKDIFFDSVEVRQVINDIKLSRESLINIAENLTSKTGIDSSEIEEKSQTEEGS